MMSELRLILLVLGVLLVLGIYLWGRRQRHLWQSPPEAEEEDWLAVLAEKRRQGLAEEGSDKAMPTLHPTASDHEQIIDRDSAPRFEEMLDAALDKESTTVAAERVEPAMTAGTSREVARADNTQLAAPTATDSDPLPTPNASDTAPAIEESASGDPIPESNLPAEGESLILTLFVTARPGTVIAGRALLEALRQAGLRFGAMDIYHYLKDQNDDGEVLFSMANMVEPGTFAPAQMEGFSTPGLVFFMQLPAHTEASVMFEKMLASARVIAQLLDAELKDESHSDMSQQTIGHLRERVKEYDFKHRRHGTAG